MSWQVGAGVMLAVAGTWCVVSTILIYEALRRRGVPVSFLWLRVLVPKYAHQYRETTRRESGRTGPLFYHWIVSINAALVAAVLLLLLELVRR